MENRRTSASEQLKGGGAVLPRGSALSDVDRLEAVVATVSGDAQFLVDGDGTVLVCNPAASSLTGVPGATIVGSNVASRIGLDGDQDLGDLLCSGRIGDVASGRVVGVEGRSEPVEVVVGRHHAMEGTVYVLSVRSVRDRLLREAELVRRATHDPLTGLPNRSLLLQHLELAIGRSSRVELGPAVLFLDLDRFKRINDSLGHNAGDELLVSVARRLESCSRPGDLVARIGGDEFVVLCDGLTSVQAVGRMARRIVHSLDEPFTAGSIDVRLSTSVGVAMADRSTGAEGASDLLAQADEAMYRAKENGGGRFAFYDREISDQAIQKLHLEAELERGISNGELVLHYQPIYEVTGGQLTGVEALVRWQHPHRGLVQPLEFIPVAEDTGMIFALGEWVLEEACRQLLAWDRSGSRPIVMSVNLSPRQLVEADIPATVGRLLSTSGVSADRLQLEITEDVMLESSGPALVALNELRQIGVGIAIDDFGTGYSSLSYLRDLPVTVLKLDRCFIEGLGTDPQASSVVAAMISLAHSFGLTAVAEGVETRTQLQALRFLDCDLAQGFFLQRPKPPDDIVELLRP